MIIYQVTLTINKEIFNEYLEWLKEHIQEMLCVEGFIDSKILQPILEEQSDALNTLCVLYTVENEFYLKQYFEKQASAMRAQGEQKFGKKFSATRAVYSTLEHFQRSSSRLTKVSLGLTINDEIQGEKG